MMINDYVNIVFIDTMYNNNNCNEYTCCGLNDKFGEI